MRRHQRHVRHLHSPAGPVHRRQPAHLPGRASRHHHARRAAISVPADQHHHDHHDLSGRGRRDDARFRHPADRERRLGNGGHRLSNIIEFPRREHRDCLHAFERRSQQGFDRRSDRIAAGSFHSAHRHQRSDREEILRTELCRALYFADVRNDDA